ncbi:MAG: hypothetical protein KBA31_21155 [Alphaproteobacteria bacterium]|nr:hypothetical protein [Alphaproteobacteria bacterium]
MFEGTKYFYVHPTGDSSIALARPDKWTASDTWLCGECNSPRPGTQELDLRTSNVQVPRDPLSFVTAGMVGVGRRELFADMGWEEVSRDLFLGKLIAVSDPKLFEGWVTFRGRYPIIVRGLREAGYRVCGTCGRVAYFAYDDSYLYPRPEEGVDIFDASGGRLIVTEKIARRIDLSKWQRVELDEIPVLDKPVDEFDELVSLYMPIGTPPRKRAPDT